VGTIDDAVEANRAFAERFDQAEAPRVPRKALVVLTCFDARVHPETFLGLRIGDAHVLRNAGGRATDDALRSLIISSKLLGTRTCMVVHHTGCGMLTVTNEDVRSMLEADTGTSAANPLYGGSASLYAFPTQATLNEVEEVEIEFAPASGASFNWGTTFPPT
jgi:carbonic anhydrase